MFKNQASVYVPTSDNNIKFDGSIWMNNLFAGYIAQTLISINTYI